MKAVHIIFAASLLLFCSVSNAQLKKSVTWEKLNMNGAGLPELGRITPSPSQLDRESYWSVGCETLDRDYSDFEKYKQYVGQTGVGYGRLQSGWAKTEKEKGKYDFEWLDKHVDGLIAQGVKPWICLCYGNPLYSDDGYDLNARLFGEGKVMKAWENYVEAIVRRYKGKVTMYEVWNEPDGGKHIESYDTYAVLFCHTAKAIRKVDGDVKIAAFGLCGPERNAAGGNYAVLAARKMKELGCLDLMEYITYHAYWPIPELINPYINHLKEELAGMGCKAQLIQGETGCPSILEYGHAMNSLEWSEYSQAKWDLRQMLNHFGMGIPYSVFTMVDLNYGWMMQSFGLVRMKLTHEPVYLRPKFYAVQNVTSIFTTELSATDELKVISNCNREIKCIGIKKGGRKIGFLLWYSDERPSDVLDRDPVNLKVEGIGNIDAVYVDMMTGKVYDMGSCLMDKGRKLPFNNCMTLSKIPLWDAPVLIIDRNEFNWGKAR